jgi:single-strand DNA-binding protein
MNSCIIMAQITEAPQLRYTQDNQMAIAEMKVQFAGLRPEEPTAEIKVIGWGNLAQEIVQKYQEGDQVVIEGRLGMNTIERPEGFKEKRAELTAGKVYAITGMSQPIASAPPAAQASTATKAATPTATKAKKATPAPVAEEADFDEIPF